MIGFSGSMGGGRGIIKDNAIDPFCVAIDQADIDRVAARLRETRLPRRWNEGGWDLGVSHDFMVRFVDHWLNAFDWRRTEVYLNAWPQYKTLMEGVELHFYHVPGVGPSPRPLLLLHGWPGSVYEFLHLIGPLTDPAAYGGCAEDAFTVVAPSLPGFGFSSAPCTGSVGPLTTALICHRLMQRLGYPRFGVQGGDFGAVIGLCLADRQPEAVAALHLNTLPIAMRPLEELNPEERVFMDEVQAFLSTEFDYFNMQKQKTNTVAFALADNPLGTAAWILEKIYAWSDHNGDLLSIFTLDQLCSAVCMYVYTDTIDTSIRMYNGLWTELKGAFRPPGRLGTPTGAAIFPREVRAARPPRSWAQAQYDIRRWTEMPRGGHFAALEQPDLWREDVQAFFREYL